MKLSSHLQRPRLLAPLTDLDVEDEDYEEERDLEFVKARGRDASERLERIREISEQKDGEINESSSAEEATPSVSASSSRSSSTVISLRPPLTLSASRTARPRLSHLVLHLANAQMRLQTPPDPIDSLNPSVLIRFRRGLLSNYSSWCSYLGQKSKIWLPEPNPRSADLRASSLRASSSLAITIIVDANILTGKQASNIPIKILYRMDGTPMVRHQAPPAGYRMETLSVSGLVRVLLRRRANVLPPLGLVSPLFGLLFPLLG
ncbi:hypothetical protein Scep_006879 [Stephania cephalantha]|uniref:Uncharacterized protein n=1 Tax=Stephania cephalantha TaxID=152367 RepID=A0AAP0K8Z1_9MAGN